MKKSAYVLLKVNTVFCAILCIILIGIPGLIFSIKAKHRLEVAKSKDDMIALGVLNIIFGTTCGVIAGIFILAMNKEAYSKPVKTNEKK